MYEWNQIGFFLIVYSFLGWCAETLIYSFTRRRYVNAGFLTLPFILTYGITMVLLAGVLPSMGDNLPAQFIYTLIVSATTDRLGNFFVSRLTGISWPDRGGIFGGRDFRGGNFRGGNRIRGRSRRYGDCCSINGRCCRGAVAGLFGRLYRQHGSSVCGKRYQCPGSGNRGGRTEGLCARSHHNGKRCGMGTYRL